MIILTPGALEAAAEAMCRCEGRDWNRQSDRSVILYRRSVRAAFNAAIAKLREEGRITDGNTVNPSITIWLLPEGESA